MSPVFRHGRLRLYLLKLLDEAPRHGYEVIRLLQDRFMGVYSPSPGTIYPRLARLEEDGLVTHDEVDGRKVYRITEKGREEIRARLDDLAELEDELTESVRDIAREVTEDVRDTVRSLREEITWAARDVRREARSGRPGQPGAGRDGAEREGTGQHGAGQDDTGQPGSGRAETGPDGASRQPQDEARRIRDEARRARDDIRDTFRSQRRGGRDRGGRQGGGRPDWSRQDWGGWADRAAGWQAWGDRREQAEQKDPGGRSGWSGWQDWAARPAGLDRLASEFARELSSAAGHAGDIGDHALGELRDILSDTLARIRDEIFTGAPQSARDPADQPAEPQPAEHGVPSHGASEHGAAEHGAAEHGPAGEAAPPPAGPDRGPTA